MNSKEMREKRSKLIADAQAAMFGENVTAEVRTNVEKMLADADAMSKVLATVEAEERSAAEQRGKSLQLPNPGEHTAENPEVRSKEIAASFRSYLATGKIETRDLTVTADGILIPTSVAAPVIAKKSAGQIINCVKKLETSTGAPVKIPLLNDTGNGFVLNSTASSTTDPTVNGVTISVDDYRSNVILIDNFLLQDAAFDLNAFVVEATYERWNRDVSKAITQGNGSNVAALNAITNTVNTTAAGVVAYKDLVAMLAAIDPAYYPNACFCMSSVTLGAILNLVDSQNRPLFLPYLDGGTSGFVGTILGHPVMLNQYLANVATGNVPIQFGDFREAYTLRTVQPGIMLKRLEERYAELNKVGYVAFGRLGGAVTDAGMHPVVGLHVA